MATPVGVALVDDLVSCHVSSEEVWKMDNVYLLLPLPVERERERVENEI